MPLASAVAINFSAPLFTALVAILLLKEQVGLARWSALIVGFLGVLIVTNPGAETFQIGALFALANAMIYGSVTAAVRGMTATESAETLPMYQLSLITVFFSLLLPFGFTMPTWWRCRADAVQRHHQRDRAILVDARAASRAGLRGDAVLLSLAGVGGCCSDSWCGATCQPSGSCWARPSWSAPACSCSGAS